MIPDDRAERISDVLAVEKRAPGVARVVTLSGAYVVDARGEGCTCEDKEFNLGPGEQCKHWGAALMAFSDILPTPFLVVEDFDDRIDPAFNLEVPDRIGRNKQLAAFADGGEQSEYRRHDIELRDVRDGHLLVSYNVINDANATYTESRHISTKLPVECLVLFEDGTIDVSDLTADERAWLQAESDLLSNKIDFAGTETGVSA
jgi:hypothetical protein